ncbi:UspA domain protein [Natronomonas pharaonis DSM 2160]|uniref:UspA domain protein n=1 Tax=Natronomonas pharaonis (strain ATCC 35678 / DSM 2160 / CIP 103997 / JCM 8858 / NBRC 14720 / NCIMB 2260 / Gabara) TaxID=348780 RepID=A0A1U7ETA0_NATPD|nr:universal stress protein [Natronomonas pharaonis]CAI48109.1 UspA domain protein [Natronomonas pharaonis DSM 2160]
MYDRILLPTDGSAGTNPAVDQAVSLAEETGAELHALFVVEDIPYAPEMMDDQVEATLRTIGEEAIENIRSRAAEADVELVTEIRDGTPHRSILDYADDAGCDLIVMGTHGRSGLDRYLLGSVTERIVRTADVPVLTVRKTDDE